MSQHTPGPWEVDEKHHEVYESAVTDLFRSQDGWVTRKGLIAVVYERYGEDGCTDGANARLIAAAPELLRELEYVMSVGRTVIDARPECDWNRLCALLARIGGE